MNNTKNQNGNSNSSFASTPLEILQGMTSRNGSVAPNKANDQKVNVRTTQTEKDNLKQLNNKKLAERDHLSSIAASAAQVNAQRREHDPENEDEEEEDERDDKEKKDIAKVAKSNDYDEYLI